MRVATPLPRGPVRPLTDGLARAGCPLCVGGLQRARRPRAQARVPARLTVAALTTAAGCEFAAPPALRSRTWNTRPLVPEPHDDERTFPF